MSEELSNDGYIDTKSDYEIEEVDESNEGIETLLVDDNNASYENIYSCESCNTSFFSIEKHIEEFHSGQEVVVQLQHEEEEANATDSPYNDFDLEEDQEELHMIKEEQNYQLQEEANSNDNEMHDVEYLDENDTDHYILAESEENNLSENIIEDNFDKHDTRHTKREIIHEEDCLDKDGRTYKRKLVKIPKFWKSEAESVILCKVCNIKYKDCDYPTHSCVPLSDSIKEEVELIIEQDPLTIKKIPKKPRNRNVSINPSSVDGDPTTPEIFECSICNTKFPSYKSFRLHLRMHDPIKSKLPPNFGDPTPGEENCEDYKTFHCDICDKNYNVEFERIHMKMHSSDPTFHCTICNKKFTNALNLSMHINAHQEFKPKPSKMGANNLELPYKCSYCGKQFARPHEKVKHERIHTGEKPHNCEICGKTFRVAYCLTLHMRTHTGARPYVCPHCNKRFKAHSVYNHHLMTHSDERPYQCTFCPKAFKTSVQLAGHKNSHTKPFNCTECNRPFATLYSVRSHMETHKKPNHNLKHKCGYCGATYARSFALRDHIKELHSNEIEEPLELLNSDATISIDLQDTISEEAVEDSLILLNTEEGDDVDGGVLFEGKFENEEIIS